MKRLSEILKLLVLAALLWGCGQSGSKEEEKNKISDRESDSGPEKEENVRRFGMITGLKPEKEAYYKELHKEAWPAILDKIKECNIRNYSIYLKKIEDKLYLFSYFEYTGDNFGEDMKKMAADPATQRWWKETDPCQSPLPDAASKGQIWSDMEEVFHMP